LKNLWQDIVHYLSNKIVVKNMQFNSISPIPEDDEELHLPELVYWASLGELAEVEKSLANGADINSADEEGYSALHAAAENGYLDVVKLLVGKGADVQHKTQYTALELAEMAGNDDVAAYLKSL
jgi:ankyrin repeat protein